MHAIRVWLVLHLLISAAVAHAATGLLRLEDVQTEVAAQNPKVRAMRTNWEKQKAQVGFVRSWADPKVGINLEKIRRGRGPKSKNAGTDMYMIEQDIPFPGKLSARKKAQIHAAKIALYDYQRTILDVQADVTAAYYEYWQLLESLRIKRAHSRILERLSAVTERQYASARVMQRDVLRAQAAADKISVELSNLEERVPAVKSRLNAFLNRPANAPLGTPEGPRADFAAAAERSISMSRSALGHPWPADGAALESATIASNVDLKTAHHHIEHSRLNCVQPRVNAKQAMAVGMKAAPELGNRP